MSNIKDAQSKLIADIGNYGWHVIKVMGDEQGAGFGYSVGLYHSCQHPEILIVGLKHELIHSIINNIGEAVKSGEQYCSGQYYPGLIGGFDCYFVEVEKCHYPEYVGQALQFYNGIPFPLLQCIYPTVKGIYPWQPEWPEEIKGLQPVLGEVKS
jgi:hypothetical protein